MRRSVAPAALVLAAAAPAAADEYVVLRSTRCDEEFRRAAATLADAHGVRPVAFDAARPDALLALLGRHAPRHVALVMPPDEIDFAFQRRFLDVATRVDDDPFVDFAFGYVTGATGAEAEALVLAGRRAAAAPRAAVLGSVSGGWRTSHELTSSEPLRRGGLPQLCGRVQGDETGHDRAFVARFLPKLRACNAVELGGHGYPDRVVGGLDAADLAGLRLDGAVVLSVACWTGVTSAWFRVEEGRVRRDRVDAGRSVALAVLRTGVCGYTAYLSPRPAGPELHRDLAALVVDGASLGEARRRDYDRTVLGFLGFGEARMDLDPPKDGAAVPPGRDAVRDVMLEDATGGVLFGDPSVRPFVPRPGDDPVEVVAAPAEDGIAVTMTCPRAALWAHCGEPTARFDGKGAMRAYARLPLGDLPVGEVVVESARVGARDVPTRVVWAVEDDRGERFLHAKVIFPRQDGREVGRDDELRVRCLVRRARTGAGARRSGG